MKREDIPYLVKHPYPNDYMEFKMLLGSALRAIYSNPSLHVVNRELFDALMEFKNGPEDFAAFFYEHNLEKETWFTCRKVIAKDKDGDLLILDKDLEGQFIEVRVPIGTGEPYIRFGTTYVQGSHRYYFFMTEYVYIDYHDTFRTKGKARKIKTKSAFGWDTTHCDEEGRSNILTNISGIVEDFINIFR